MVDNNVEEFFELDVGYEQQVGGDGVYPVRQWRLQAKVKNTRQRITMLKDIYINLR
jgi:hypothetical protein